MTISDHVTLEARIGSTGSSPGRAHKKPSDMIVIVRSIINYDDDHDHIRAGLFRRRHLDPPR